MRRGELLALRWQDIEIRDGLGIINVRHTLSRQKVLETTKTENSQRPVVVTQDILDILKQHRIRQAEERLKAGPEYQNNDLVFCTIIGTPLNAENTMKRHFHRLLEKAEVKRIRFHDLRHCSATLALVADGSLKVLQLRLGHASVKTTGTSTHIRQSKLR